MGSSGPVTRQRLLRAAREVFSQRGYAKTTPAAVAESAGITRTAFYRYFPSKLELVRALVEDTNTTVIDELIGSVDAIDDPVERLAWLFHASARFNADDRSYGRFLTTLLMEAYREPELADLAEAEVERFRRFFADAVGAAHEAGGIQADPDALVDLLVSLQWGLGLFAAFIGDPQRLDAAVDVAVERVAPSVLARSAEN